MMVWMGKNCSITGGFGGDCGSGHDKGVDVVCDGASSRCHCSCSILICGGVGGGKSLQLHVKQGHE